MSGQKRPAATELVVDVEGPSCKKRGVTTKTVDKWITENDKALNTTMWLQCDRKDREYVASMKCTISVSVIKIGFVVLETTTQLLSHAGSTNLRTSLRTMPNPICTSEQCCSSGCYGVRSDCKGT